VTWDATPIPWLPNMSVTEAYWIAFSVPAIIIGAIVMAFSVQEVYYHWHVEEDITFALAVSAAGEIVVLWLMAIAVLIIGVASATIPEPVRVEQQERQDFFIILLLSIDFGILVAIGIKAWLLWYFRKWRTRLRTERHTDYHAHQPEQSVGAQHE